MFQMQKIPVNSTGWIESVQISDTWKMSVPMLSAASCGIFSIMLLTAAFILFLSIKIAMYAPLVRTWQKTAAAHSNSVSALITVLYLQADCENRATATINMIQKSFCTKTAEYISKE